MTLYWNQYISSFLIHWCILLCICFGMNGLWLLVTWTIKVLGLSLMWRHSCLPGGSCHTTKYPHWTLYCSSIQFNGMLVVYNNSWFWQLSCGIHVSSALLPRPKSPLPPLHSVLTANLYSDIKPDDSPVKGTKRGKGKKEKKKSPEPFEKKKPKLDELKVLDSAPALLLPVVHLLLVCNKKVQMGSVTLKKGLYSYRSFKTFLMLWSFLHS